MEDQLSFNISHFRSTLESIKKMNKKTNEGTRSDWDEHLKESKSAANNNAFSLNPSAAAFQSRKLRGKNVADPAAVSDLRDTISCVSSRGSDRSVVTGGGVAMPRRFCNMLKKAEATSAKKQSQISDSERWLSDERAQLKLQWKELDKEKTKLRSKAQLRKKLRTAMEELLQKIQRSSQELEDGKKRLHQELEMEEKVIIDLVEEKKKLTFCHEELSKDLEERKAAGKAYIEEGISLLSDVDAILLKLRSVCASQRNELEQYLLADN